MGRRGPVVQGRFPHHHLFLGRKLNFGEAFQRSAGILPLARQSPHIKKSFRLFAPPLFTGARQAIREQPAKISHFRRFVPVVKAEQTVILPALIREKTVPLVIGLPDSCRVRSQCPRHPWSFAVPHDQSPPDSDLPPPAYAPVSRSLSSLSTLVVVRFFPAERSSGEEPWERGRKNRLLRKNLIVL